MKEGVPHTREMKNSNELSDQDAHNPSVLKPNIIYSLSESMWDDLFLNR